MTLVLLDGYAWLCYGSGKDSSGDMETERLVTGECSIKVPPSMFFSLLSQECTVQRNRDM